MENLQNQDSGFSSKVGAHDNIITDKECNPPHPTQVGFYINLHNVKGNQRHALGYSRKKILFKKDSSIFSLKISVAQTPNSSTTSAFLPALYIIAVIQ